MSEQGYEYDQFAPQTSGRLFSSSMFGFNKEEVLEYLDELADENYQRQEASDLQIQDLTQRLQTMEQNYQQNYYQATDEEFESVQQQAAQLSEDLEVAKAATQQAEDDLAEVREQLYNSQQESAWLREEYQKTDAQIADLRRQIDSLSEGQWDGQAEADKKLAEAEARIADLQDRLDQADTGQWNGLEEADKKLTEANRKVLEAGRALSDNKRQLADTQEKLAAAEKRSFENEKQITDLRAQLEEAIIAKNTAPPSTAASAAIIADANAEAERIRAMAIDEKERIRRQIRNSAGGLAESITNLRVDVSGVENDVTVVLEAVQNALSDILSSLTRTEQNLNTLGVQVERFPATSAPVPPPIQQQPVYFQPSEPIAPATAPRKNRRAAPVESYGQGGFRRIVSDSHDAAPASNVRPFRATYSTGPAAVAWPQTSEAYQPEEDTDDDRKRALAESLVDTLVQMLN